MEPDVGVSVPPSALREKWQKKKKKKNPSGLRESCLPLGLSLKLFPPLEMLFLLAPTHSLTMGLLSQRCVLCLPWSQHTPYSLFHDPGLASPPDSEYYVGRPWPT